MSASPLYALGRLHRAIETATGHHDPETRRRAEEKALAWEAVLSGMAAGTLDIGSRTPVANTPAWVTLEVAHGGFATGRYIAEGPLTVEERQWLERLPAGPSSDRARLNTWFLSDEGLHLLAELLRTGRYAIDVPEHGALLVVAWLVEHGHDALALDLVAELYPLVDRLRFYPVRTERPLASGALVHLRSAGEVARQLRDVEVPTQVAAMNEALHVWLPLYDRLVALWAQTVEGDWPCQRWPEDWAQQRASWLTDCESASAEAHLCGEYQKARSNFAILREGLERCVVDSSVLSGREVGRIRMALQRSIARWGEPGSPERTALRATQQVWASLPTHKEVAAVLVDRLSHVPSDAGIPDLDPVLAPVRVGPTNDEAAVPVGFVAKVERALEAPVEELVERGVVPSSEVLAEVLPQITSHVAAAAFENDILRDLYARIYAAFRRRRSLLLLNLEHQVQIEELPWVQVLRPFRKPNAVSEVKATDTLRHASLLALTSFPQTILPNPLVRELTALARQARLNVPLVEELAADIFMGTFTLKWREAAAVASTVMAGTLYARYYDLPPPGRWAPAGHGADGLIDRARQRWGKRTAADFAQACNQRAREAAIGDGSFVARNGTVIEQSQILTTHNLAQLVAALSISDRFAALGGELASTCFAWVVREQNTRYDSWHSQLQMLKNTAYAWRQAIFFLSFSDPADWGRAIDELSVLLEPHPAAWQERFRPVVDGLGDVLRGERFDGQGGTTAGRRFLGWSVGRHWLLPHAA